MTTVAIALGANIGDRLGNLRAAVASLPDHGVTPSRASSVWETPPVPADQPPFLNAALLAETNLAPGELLAALKRIEHDLGRRPGRRWGPRPIDLDILLYGELQLHTPDLTIPHPRIAERAFVLAPLAEIWPAPIPGLAAAPADLLQRLGLQGARRYAPLLPPA